MMHCCCYLHDKVRSESTNTCNADTRLGRSVRSTDACLCLVVAQGNEVSVIEHTSEDHRGCDTRLVKSASVLNPP